MPLANWEIYIIIIINARWLTSLWLRSKRTVNQVGGDAEEHDSKRLTLTIILSFPVESERLKECVFVRLDRIPSVGYRGILSISACVGPLPVPLGYPLILQEHTNSGTGSGQ